MVRVLRKGNQRCSETMWKPGHLNGPTWSLVGPFMSHQWLPCICMKLAGYVIGPLNLWLRAGHFWLYVPLPTSLGKVLNMNTLQWDLYPATELKGQSRSMEKTALWKSFRTQPWPASYQWFNFEADRELFAFSGACAPWALWYESQLYQVSPESSNSMGFQANDLLIQQTLITFC